MANFEYEYSDKDYQLIGEQKQNSLTINDYVKLTVYSGDTIATRNDGINAIFYSSLNTDTFTINISPNVNASLDNFTEITVGGEFNDFKIYQNPNGQIYIKPNDIFDEFELPQDNYEIKIDFLNQLGVQFGDSEIVDTSCDYGMFINPNDLNNNTEEEAYEYALGIWPTIGQIACGSGITNPDSDNKWRYTVCCPNGAPGGGNQCVDNPGGEVVIVPVNNPLTGEVFYDTYGEACNNVQSSENTLITELYQFVIKEISTSRKEVRLKLLNKDIGIQSDSDKYLISSIKEKLDNQFNYLLNIGSDHIPIMNYQFDTITDGVNNQSIILKLYEPLPRNIRNINIGLIQQIIQIMKIIII